MKNLHTRRTLLGGLMAALNLISIDVVSGNNINDTTLVTLSGQGFSPSNIVKLNSQVLSSTYNGSSSLIATIPSGLTPGLYSISVTDSSGDVSTLANIYTVSNIIWSDNFNGSNTSQLQGRVTPVGGKTWNESTVGSIAIVSNQAAQQNIAGGDKYAWVDSGRSDGTYSVKIPSLTGAAFNLFRFVDTNNHFIVGCNSTTLVFYVRVAGGYTSLGTSTIAAGDIIAVVMNGSSITIKRNGSTVIGPITNTNHQSATKMGIMGQSSASLWDDALMTT